MAQTTDTDDGKNEAVANFYAVQDEFIVKPSEEEEEEEEDKGSSSGKDSPSFSIDPPETLVDFLSFGKQY